MMIEAVSTSEMSVNFYRTTQHNNPEDSHLHTHCHENLKSKRVEFVSDRMSYLTLRGRWCDIIVLNIHALTEDKCDGIKNSFYEELQNAFDHSPTYHMKILLGYFNAKVGREGIFQLTIGNESLHETINDRIRIVNFATSKNLVVKSTIFPNRKIHKYTWTSNGKTYNQIDHVLVDRRQQSSTHDVRSFRGTDCDNEHYLVVAKTYREAIGK
jgi:hypothetical protein